MAIEDQAGNAVHVVGDWGEWEDACNLQCEKAAPTEREALHKALDAGALLDYQATQLGVLPDYLLAIIDTATALAEDDGRAREVRTSV